MKTLSPGHPASPAGGRSGVFIARCKKYTIKKDLALFLDEDQASFVTAKHGGSKISTLRNHQFDKTSHKQGTPITIQDYIRLMHKLGFVQYKQVIKAEEKYLIELWDMMGGTVDNTVNAENLIILLGALMNIAVKDVVSKCSNEDTHNKKGLLCFDGSGNIHFRNRKDVYSLHKKYVVLSTNRTNLLRVEIKGPTYSFKPEVNKKSELIY